MKKARTGSSRAMPSKAVPPPPKSGPTNKIGVLKIAHPKAKPGPRGTSEIELALEKLVGVSKKFRLLDATGLSHRPHAMGVTTTHAARVPAFDNLGDDSSPDVRQTHSPIWTIERCASPPPSMSGEFLCFSLAFVTTGAYSYFTGVVRPPPSLDFSLGDLGESLESCLHCVSFVLPSYFYAFVLALIDCLIS
jgi:hypothetical protein